MSDSLDLEFAVTYRHRIFFTEGAFASGNPVLADLFAGDRAIALTATNQGLRAHSWGIRYDTIWQDLLNPVVQRSILRDLKNHAIVAAVLAPPCQTFSIAQNRASAIRTTEEPWGVTDRALTPKESELIKLCSALAHVAVNFFRQCVASRVPACVEHPRTSRLWRTGELKQLMKLKCCRTVLLDQCQFGAQRQTSTQIWFCHVDPQDLAAFERLCKPHSGLCSASLKPHHGLSGLAPGGTHWARLAASYPKKLAHAIVHALTAEHVARATFNQPAHQPTL